MPNVTLAQWNHKVLSPLNDAIKNWHLSQRQSVLGDGEEKPRLLLRVYAAPPRDVMQRLKSEVATTDRHVPRPENIEIEGYWAGKAQTSFFSSLAPVIQTPASSLSRSRHLATCFLSWKSGRLDLGWSEVTRALRRQAQARWWHLRRRFFL